MEIFTNLAIIPKLWGYEKHIHNNNGYCGKILVVVPNGYSSSLHYHRAKHETFHILQGPLFIELATPQNDQQDPTIEEFEITQHILNTGDSVRLEPYTAHRFWAIHEIASFIEFSTTDTPGDTYRLIVSGPRPT